MDYSIAGPNGGGTTDMQRPDSYAETARICASVWPELSLEQAMERAGRHADLMRLRGAVLDRLWIRWWPVTRSDRRGHQVTQRRRLGLWSGHKCYRRGRHWDRTRH